MCLFFETIQVSEGKILHAEWHTKRMKRTIEHFFGCPCDSKTHDISALLGNVPFPDGLMKCRVLYSSVIEDIEFMPYIRPQPERFRLIECNEIDYSFKFADRADIDELFGKRGNADEIIIVRNGCITDTSIANLVFFDGQNLFTPDTPLLRGTHRERLLHERKIVEKRITTKNISEFKSFYPINAMSKEQPEMISLNAIRY